MAAGPRSRAADGGRIGQDGHSGGGCTMSARVLVAMSGGVDSSVAAAILRERGYDVVGVAMRLTPEGPTPAASRRRGTCCSHEDFEDARRVAERMDFPFYVVDLRAEFGARVIDNFVSEYLKRPHAQPVCDVQSRDQVRSLARARRGARRGLRGDRPLRPYRARPARPLPSLARRRRHQGSVVLPVHARSG